MRLELARLFLNQIKYSEDSLDLSVKQLVIQSSPISLSQIMCGMLKSKHVVSSKVG